MTGVGRRPVRHHRGPRGRRSPQRRRRRRRPGQPPRAEVRLVGRLPVGLRRRPGRASASSPAPSPCAWPSTPRAPSTRSRQHHDPPGAEVQLRGHLRRRSSRPTTPRGRATRPRPPTSRSIRPTTTCSSPRTATGGPDARARHRRRARRHPCGGRRTAGSQRAGRGRLERVGSTSRPRPDQRVYVLGAVTPPSATIAPVTDVTATSATFNGTVNPNGGAAVDRLPLRVQRRRGRDVDARARDPTWTSATARSDIAVSQPATGLEPNTEYRVRLVASQAVRRRQRHLRRSRPSRPTRRRRRYPASGPARSPTPRRVLGGQVDPNRSHTTYRFEYGTDTELRQRDRRGQRRLRRRATCPSRRRSRASSRTRPTTSASSRPTPPARARGPDQTFTTAASPPQPSGRAYEMVSPLDKNGGDIERDCLRSAELTDRGALAPVTRWRSRRGSHFGDIESGTLTSRTTWPGAGTTGWTTEGITPPIDDDSPEPEPTAPRVFGPVARPVEGRSCAVRGPADPRRSSG